MLTRTKRTGLLLAAGLLTMAGVATANANSSAASPDDCPRANVCVWGNVGAAGEPGWNSEGNLTRELYSAQGITIFNNGERHPGADHIRYSYKDLDTGSNHRGCLHYPRDEPTAHRSEAHKISLKYLKWGKEC
ncbi:hypothetical protein ACFYWS_25295 [Streptomyces sp. NPDC002795]|uniref:hypothetical protein n=1 Tax=Streptomyces sp. NPDC002795 TaxID=3364665 RepID=UPI0036BAEB4C